MTVWGQFRMTVMANYMTEEGNEFNAVERKKQMIFFQVFLLSARQKLKVMNGI